MKIIDQNMMPKLVADINDGLFQSLECRYFVGVANKVTVKGDEVSVISFENPPNSGVIIYINGGEYVNFSEAPVDIKVAGYTEINGPMCESRKILPANLGCCNSYPSARILSGNRIHVESAEICREFLLAPLTSQVIRTGGNVILPPGTKRTYIVTSVESNNMSVVTVNFEWWEEKID